ncbi:extracellular solute-binding protein [Actinosynnema pretiosum subsp. pretiosum]|uniref:Extracellular solute-binding protein family 1 n=2 Tax=Actinosynnema TaxID=40566 RepID=C6W9C0_ACTMD|nr:extracellular solute-binding protein [Actinosynnema mirum]ACU35283.1 extracellular solute-binding protein family 1 [Actinosynnema mirum DSM 43827]QUF07020.1 extracellular solute-binding protein [Actinosynnema pretiosum subsp. pretiosum]
MWGERRGRAAPGGLLLCGLLLGGALAGCAEPEAGWEERSGPIVFADSKDTSVDRQIARLVEMWNRFNPDQPVSFQEQATGSDAYRAQLIAHSQRSKREEGAPCYDVMAMDVVWTAEFAEGGFLAEVSDRDLDLSEFRPESLRAARYARSEELGRARDGAGASRLWAVPWRADAGLLYYRTDLVAEPPTSFAGLREAALAVSRREPSVAGYAGQFRKAYEGLSVNAFEAMWAFEGDPVPVDARGVPHPALDAGSAMGVRSLVGAVRDGWLPRSTLDYDEDASWQAFGRGEVALMRNWPYAYAQLTSPDRAEGSLDPALIGVAPLPWESALGGWNLGVSTCTRHGRTAREFVRFLTDPARQRTLLEQAGFAPTRTSLYEDESLWTPPHLKVLREALDSARPRPAVPNYDLLTRLVQEQVGEAMRDGRAVDARVEALADGLTTLPGLVRPG